MTTTIYPGGLSGSTVYTGNDQIITGKKTFLAGSAANVPLTIKGAASQTGNLTEWQDNLGNVLARIAANGDVYSGATKLTGRRTVTLRFPHTYAYPGTFLSATGPAPYFTVPLPTGQSATLVEVDYGGNASGSATFNVETYNGTSWAAVAGGTGLVAGTAQSRTALGVALADAGVAALPNTAFLRVNFTAVSSPNNVQIVLHIDYTVA